LPYKELKAQKMESTSFKKIAELAACKFNCENNDYKIVTDFHVVVDNLDHITISDDESNELSSGTVDGISAASKQECEEFMKSTLAQMDNDGAFSSTKVYKPFSFILEDNEGEQIAELHIVDEENIYVSGELLEGLDKELDDFFANLMKDN
jgi:hypothetical protein